MFDYKTITSYEAACADQNRDPKALPDVTMMEPGLAKATIAFVMLCVISDSINKNEAGEKTKANFYDTDERKWSNWMKVEANEENPSGVGLSFYDAVDDYSYANVPARLTCRDPKRSEFFFTQHKALWEEYTLHRG